MICKNCGHEIDNNTQLCENCGAEQELVTAGGSGNIRLCPDGKYRWYYEFPMLRNPVILFTIWKVLLIAAMFPTVIVFLSEISDGFLSASKAALTVLGVSFGIIVVLSCIAYLIVAASYGFKYIVLFVMDETSISHIQQDKQFKKAQAMSWLIMLAGSATNSPGTVGTGILASTKQSTISNFKNVDSVIGLRRQGTIKVNQLFAKNQVYVYPEDYDFVWNYITSRCTKAKIK